MTFRPARPDEFAIAVTHGMAGVRDPNTHQEKLSISAADGPKQAPPPKPLTLVLFYLLAAGTVGMAAWAMISIIR